MKYILILFIAFCAGCINANNILSDNLAGVYAAHYEGEYSKGEDTLIISPINENAYGIERRSHFQKRKDGVWMPVQTNKVYWTVIYDERDHILHEQRKGILLFVNNKDIVWGNQHYTKCR